MSRQLRWQILVLICMYVGYTSLMVCRNTAIVASPAMIADPSLGMDKAAYGRLMAFHSAGAIAGKLCTGLAVDLWGGRLIFLLMLALTGATTAAFGMASRFPVLAGLNFLGQGAKAGGWPAMAGLIRVWYRPDQHGTVWGIISTSSRVGVLTATMFLGYLLTFMPWRQLFYVATIFTLVSFVLGLFFLRSGPAAVGLEPILAAETEVDASPHPLDGLSLKQAIGQFMLSPRVWLIGLAMSFMTIMMDFLNFIPLYLKESLHLDPGHASMGGSAFPAGCFVSVLGAGYLYDRLTRRQRVPVIGGLLAGGAVAVAILWLLPRMGLGTTSATYLALLAIFFMGVAVAPAYYLPMSVFSISYGGPHCGFLICLLDIFGYAGAMIFNYFGGSLAEVYGWTTFLCTLLAISLLAAALMLAFLFLDHRAEDRAPN